jgi:lipopolysaccharide/colanic/teichoic acid biosynthesis glycosyltransferase
LGQLPADPASAVHLLMSGMAGLRSADDSSGFGGGTRAVPRFPLWKRGLDLALGLPGLLVAAAVASVYAAALRLTGDDGPVFYRAVRVGEGGSPFRIVKLRTMRTGSSGPRITSAADHRITPLGRRLRRTKLDELPQLWNVVRGQMSLVGPRPEDWSDPLHQLVFTARPGITGLAQIAYRDEETMVPLADTEEVYRDRILPAKVLFDAEYLRHRSLRVDLRIIGGTLSALVGRRPAGQTRSGESG